LIYVTVGNHYMGFNRLIKALDAIAKDSAEEWFAQTGYCSYVPSTIKSERFIPYAQSLKCIQNSVCVISHAGIGTIINAERCGTPIVIFPRRKMFGEHGNDHQLEICSELKKCPRHGVFVVEDVNEIPEILTTVLAASRFRKIPYYAEKQNINEAISNFLSSIIS
jgi:beta-1,4-N-acetylglucosaminyltransferase